VCVCACACASERECAASGPRGGRQCGGSAAPLHIRGRAVQARPGSRQARQCCKPTNYTHTHTQCCQRSPLPARVRYAREQSCISLPFMCLPVSIGRDTFVRAAWRRAADRPTFQWLHKLGARCACCPVTPPPPRRTRVAQRSARPLRDWEVAGSSGRWRFELRTSSPLDGATGLFPQWRYDKLGATLRRCCEAHNHPVRCT